MSGVFDFLTNGAPATSTTTGGTTAQLPAWYEDYQRALLASGAATASEPFQPYPGQRIADLTAPQEAGIAGASEYGAATSPLAQAGAASLEHGAAGFDPNELQQIMNPYSTQVADILGKQGMERWNQQILPGVNDQFTQGGQFGSKRHTDAVTNAAEVMQREIGNEQTQALSTGYGQGLSGLEAMRGMDISGGTAALGGAQGGLNVLQSAGALEQGQGQKSLDQQYADFLEQKNYPKDQLAFLKSLSPTAPTSSTASTSTNAQMPAGNAPLTDIAGLVALYNSIYPPGSGGNTSASGVPNIGAG